MKNKGNNFQMHFSRNYIITVLIAACLMASLLMPACNHQQQPSGEAALKQWYKLEYDTLMQALVQLDSMVMHNAPVPQMQQQFAAGRLRYKRMEGVVEYFFQGLTRRINGPALPDVKTEDNQVWPPHGFQVVEQFLFSPFSDSLRNAVSNEIKLLQTDLRFVASNLEQTTILPRHVRELVQHQIIRIATLGITGMDAPLSQLSLPEAAHALHGICNLLAAYTTQKKDFSKKTKKHFSAAIAFANAGASFNTFDRITFLRGYLAPLSNVLRNIPQPPSAEDQQFAKPFDGTLSDLLTGKGFQPDYYTTYAAAKSSEAKVALGKQLFFDTRLSRSSNISCATCHRPEQFFTDGLAKAANVVHGGSLPRNTPTLYYAALQRDQFYDHRSTTLEDQVNEVMSNRDEFDLEAKQVAQKIALAEKYAALFKSAFDSSIIGGYEVRNAIAAYIRTLNPFASRFDAYMRGNDSAMSRQELEGFNLFAGKAKCATCHFIPLFNGTVPPWFTKSESEIIGVPEILKWANAKVDADPGRFKWNKLEELRHAFKTPTVRNAGQTAPYMHNGVFKTLDQVVNFYQKGGGVGMGMELPFQTLPFDSLQLNTGEQKAIVAFLHTLTDNVNSRKGHR